MLGKLIIGAMSAILNFVAVLMIIIGTIAGAYMAIDQSINAVVGAVLGFIVSFLAVVVYLGLVFLILEINNNLKAIRNSIDK